MFEAKSLSIVSLLKNGWYLDSHKDYQYFINGKWTGVTIMPFRTIYIPIQIQPKAKGIQLKNSYWRVHFCPQSDINKCRDVIESPTLYQAKKLAEWYYSQWLKVNKECINKDNIKGV